MAENVKDNNTTITIKCDKDVKAQAKDIFSQMGLDISSGINLYLRQVVRTKKIPFEITVNND